MLLKLAEEGTPELFCNDDASQSPGSVDINFFPRGYGEESPLDSGKKGTGPSNSATPRGRGDSTATPNSARSAQQGAAGDAARSKAKKSFSDRTLGDLYGDSNGSEGKGGEISQSTPLKKAGGRRGDSQPQSKEKKPPTPSTPTTPSTPSGTAVVDMLSVYGAPSPKFDSANPHGDANSLRSASKDLTVKLTSHGSAVVVMDAVYPHEEYDTVVSPAKAGSAPSNAVPDASIETDDEPKKESQHTRSEADVTVHAELENDGSNDDSGGDGAGDDCDDDVDGGDVDAIDMGDLYPEKETLENPTHEHPLRTASLSSKQSADDKIAVVSSPLLSRPGFSRSASESVRRAADTRIDVTRPKLTSSLSRRSGKPSSRPTEAILFRHMSDKSVRQAIQQHGEDFVLGTPTITKLLRYA